MKHLFTLMLCGVIGAACAQPQDSAGFRKDIRGLQAKSSLYASFTQARARGELRTARTIFETSIAGPRPNFADSLVLAKLCYESGELDDATRYFASVRRRYQVEDWPEGLAELTVLEILLKAHRSGKPPVWGPVKELQPFRDYRVIIEREAQVAIANFYLATAKELIDELQRAGGSNQKVQLLRQTLAKQRTSQKNLQKPA